MFARLIRGIVAVGLGCTLPVPVGGAAAVAQTAQPFRAFTPDSYWNTPLAPDAPVDPQSSDFIRFLEEDNEQGYLRIVGTESSGGWGEPIFWAKPSDPVYKVKQTQFTLPEAFDAIRIPSEAQVPATSDAQMTIYDLAAGSVYKLQKANYDGATNTWSAGGGSWYSTTSDGLHPKASPSADPRNHGHRGVPPATHAVRWDEVQAGRIDHALKIAVNTAHQNHVWPMTGSDGDSLDLAALPQGARLRIKPSLDLGKLNLKPAALTISRACSATARSSGTPRAATPISRSRTRFSRARAGSGRTCWPRPPCRRSPSIPTRSSA